MNKESKRDREKKMWAVHIKMWLAISEHTTQKEYCLKLGLSESAFSKWKNRLLPKLKRSNFKNKKPVFWEREINHWLKTNHSQADYCTQLDESEAAFSRWKTRFHPDLKYRRNRTKQKNRYLKYSKISNDKTDILINCFIHRQSAKDAAGLAKISVKTANRYYRMLKIKFVTAASDYPELFYGAGMLLLLGPPPYVLVSLKKKCDSRNEKTVRQELGECAFEMIFLHSHLRLSNAEAWWFLHYGMNRYYYLIYSNEHGLDPQVLNENEYSTMARNKPIGDAAKELWYYYLEKNHEEYDALIALWRAIYYQREYDISDNYYKTMIHDLKWALMHCRPGKKKDYWDEYMPSKEEMLEVEREINERILQISQIFGDEK